MFVSPCVTLTMIRSFFVCGRQLAAALGGWGEGFVSALFAYHCVEDHASSVLLFPHHLFIFGLN